MTTNVSGITSRVFVTVVRGAIIAMALLAWTDRAAAQTAPQAPTPAAPPAATTTQPATTTGTIEVGAGGVSASSFKAGEFNGLGKKGLFGIGNLDVRGGGAYDSNSAFRWRIIGTDLGLKTRGLSAEVGDQGRFRLTFGYSELLRSRSDSYQTPYNGAGTNTLTLPGTWQVPMVASSSATNNQLTSVSARGLVKTIGGARYIDTMTTSPTVGTLISPTAAQLAVINGAADADLPLFHNVNLSTKRTQYDAGFTFSLTPEWGLDASVRAEHKDGLKPMSTVSRNTGADIATIIPDVIDADTAQVNTGLNFKGEKNFFQGAYYGSFFTNNVPSMSWQNWASGPTGTGTLNTMSSAPSNAFHQFTMEGRHNFSAATRLVASGSYGRNTQNDAFLTLPSTPVVPVSSLNGLVVSSAFNAKLTSRVGKKLNLNAGYKFDDRDNRTAVHIYQFADAEDAPSVSALFPAGSANLLGAVIAQNANANRPYSKKMNQANADAELAVAKGEWLKAGYDFDRINRWCTGSWINCADAGVTNEHRFRAGWRADLGETVNARIDYAYSRRRTPNYDENAFLALVPYANVSPTTATGGATALSFMLANGWNGWGPALGFATTTGNMNVFFPSNNAMANAAYANGNRISEIQGLRRYYVSDRNRSRTRGALNWQATDALSFQAGGDLTSDDYTDATYGLQTGKKYAANLDGTYTVGDGISVGMFYSFENQRALTAGNTYTANSNVANVNGFVALSGNACDGYTTLQQRNNNNKLDPCLDWSANMLDRVHTVGFTLARKKAKLDLTGDLIFARARTTNDVSGGNWANNPLALPGATAGTVAAFFIAATPLPAVTTDTAELRVNAKYTVRANQSLRVVYSYMRMRSVDWAYDGMQIGAATLSGVLPTNETAFNFGVHVVGVAYVIGF
jgi:MtrB/PioB family decaheme-associated outer membrane protein